MDDGLPDLWLQELLIDVQVREFPVLGGQRTLNVITVADLLKFLAKQDMQSLVSLYGPDGEDASHEFWLAAQDYEWCKAHPATQEVARLLHAGPTKCFH